MTPKRDALIRRRAQAAYEFAVSEIERTDTPRVNYGRPDYEEQSRRRDVWENTPGLREYRSWLYDVQSFANYRRRHPIVRMLRRSRNIGRIEQGEYNEPAPRFSWRWQNLDEDLRVPDQSPTVMGLPLPDIRHQGRAWFDWYVRSADRKPFKLEVDWAFGKAVWSSGVSYSRTNSGTITLHASIRPVASVYLIFKHLWPRREHQPSRTYSLSIVDAALHWDFGKPGSGDEWHRNDPLNWMRGCRFLLDDIFGRPHHTVTKVGPKVDAVASFPEGDYPLLLQREVRTWKRPRWPFVQTHRYVDIEAVQPALSQGKGDNSWDLGPDGIWGMSSPGHSYEDAVAAYVKSTLRDRRKQGHLAPEHRSVSAEVQP